MVIITDQIEAFITVHDWLRNISCLMYLSEMNY